MTKKWLWWKFSSQIKTDEKSKIKILRQRLNFKTLLFQVKIMREKKTKRWHKRQDFVIRSQNYERVGQNFEIMIHFWGRALNLRWSQNYELNSQILGWQVEIFRKVTFRDKKSKLCGQKSNFEMWRQIFEAESQNLR